MVSDTRHGLVLLLLVLATVCGAQTRWTELSEWEFSKEGESEWQRVVLPHSCNALDGQSARYYRGLTHYRREVVRSGSEQYLYIMGAAQRSCVYVNGQLVVEHGGGYTPYCVRLTPFMQVGSNTVQIDCDNSLNTQLAPVSSDFNKNNGLHNMVWLVETAEVWCDFSEMGYDALHVTPLNVSAKSADVRINSLVRNATDKEKDIKVVFNVKNMKGKTIATNTERVKIAPNRGMRVGWTYLMSNPHLWNGLSDPYLYKAEIQLWEKGKMLESNQTDFGVRSFSMDSVQGFMLNGKPYQLRGFSIHQDWAGSASAVKKEQTDRDFEIVRELGCNVVRLAHYPHNRYILDKCDELGLIVQTEIPWVNECGDDTTRYDQKAYTDNLHQQLREMITNHYNHPSVCFWGLWNELGNIDGSRPQGAKLDKEAVLNTTASLYRLAHRLDSTRYVGFADASFGMRTPELRYGEHFDYFAFNAYNGWYSNIKSPEGAAGFYKTLERLHQRAPYVAITEYGSGANAFCHSENPAATTKPSVGGARHDEEWGNIVHERHLQALCQSPWLQFSTGWILFDFAVAARHEGYMLSSDGVSASPDSTFLYTNDKGLVTRNREVKKDAFYLYKSAWNTSEPTLYITSRRFTQRQSDSITVKAYSNLSDLVLYQNGRMVQKLQGSGEPSGVIWTFMPVPFETEADKFRIVGTDAKGREYSDEVIFHRKNKQ